MNAIRSSISHIVDTLKQQAETKIDFVADVRQLYVQASPIRKCLMLCPCPDTQTTEFLPVDGMPILSGALAQLGERMDPSVPVKFLRAMEANRLHRAADLINGLMSDTGADNETRFLIRTLEGKVRAVLSNSYRIMDNQDLAFAVLQQAQTSGAQLVECSLSDNHMRMKLMDPTTYNAIEVLRDNAPNSSGYGAAQAHLDRIRSNGNNHIGDFGRGGPAGPNTVYPMTTISNSETGRGGLHVRAGVFFDYCTNGCIFDHLVSEIHLGGKLDAGLLSPATIAAESQVKVMAAVDAIANSFDAERFAALCAKVQGNVSTPIKAPSTAVDNIIKASDHLTENAKDDILAYFSNDYAPTRGGLASAVSRLAQDLDDGDHAFELESLAGDIMMGKVAVA